MFEAIERKKIVRKLEGRYKEKTILRFRNAKKAKNFYNKFVKNKLNIRGWISVQDDKVLYIYHEDFDNMKLTEKDIQLIDKAYSSTNVL